MGAPSTPRTAVLPRPSRLLDRRLPLHGGQSLHPAPTAHLAGLRVTRHQRGFKPFTRPVFPPPVATRMERAALGLSPELRTPPTRSRRRTPRRGQAIEHVPGTTRSTSHQSILQSCSSLTTCDLASHDELRASVAAGSASAGVPHPWNGSSVVLPIEFMRRSTEPVAD